LQYSNKEVILIFSCVEQDVKTTPSANSLLLFNFCGWVVMMSGLPRNYGFPQNLRSWFQDIRI